MRKMKLLVWMIGCLLSLNDLHAQALRINEYSASNQTAQNDNYGQTPDWVEIYCPFTSSLNLSNYYLSNDPNNLLKWKFPTNFTIAVNGIRTIWLSGRNEVSNGQIHANFTLDQCKGQWLILTDNNTSGRVIRDSVKIRQHAANHTWGRKTDGDIMWNVFTNQTSFGLSNNTLPAANKFDLYAPTPTFSQTPGWYPGNLVQIDIILTATNTIGDYGDYNNYEVWYTTNGDVPLQSGPTSTLFTATNSAVPIVIYPSGNNGTGTEIWRARTFPKATSTINALPSFIETNTYFSEPDDQLLSDRFGVLSIAIDTNFFQVPLANTIGHAEYFENKKLITEGYSAYGKQDFETWIRKQKGFTVNLDDERGFGCAIEYPLFNDVGLGASTRTFFPTIQVKAGDFESYSRIEAAPANTLEPNGTGIRDLFAQTYAIKNNIDVNGLHAKPIILFVNGRYRGIHYIMENYDVYYNNSYKKQPIDKQDLLLHHFIGGFAAGSISSTWTNDVYNFITTRPMSNPANYATAMSRLDKSSFMDYMIYNSFLLNSDLFDYNVAFAKGYDNTKPGNKWHYFMANAPNILGQNSALTKLTNPALTTYDFPNFMFTSPCIYVQQTTTLAASSFTNFSTKGHAKLLEHLLGSPTFSVTFNPGFRTEYLNRYQDLINGPFRCEKMYEHLNYIKTLYAPEIPRHELKYNIAQVHPSGVNTFDFNTDTLLRENIRVRCSLILDQFKKPGCYGLIGPYQLIVKVEPVGAGDVRINTIIPEKYDHFAEYYKGPLSFKAIPKDTQYVFDHWELKVHSPLNNRPLSLDSISIGFQTGDEVVAVFTDKKTDISMPTGFTPNGDGVNDSFSPLGPAIYSKEFEFRVWNRWGQEVYRSTDPRNGWDGTFQSSPSQTGVYAYLITYKNAYNESKVLKGNVTLIR